ncbi:MAG TPA: plastocyanin/azurin family copper-binding protein [Solirubrobacteraceae bacterium]|nr:plastocyanin/azurin family copper-binding protein [Solirubrobacteraceae bacterium]
MSRCFAIPAVVAALALASGCGSSGSSSSETGSSSSATSSTAAPAPSGKGSFKVTTTPKFAPATGPLRSGTVPIAYRNIAIAPDTVRVKVGSTIRWTNFDAIAHNVTSAGGPQKFASNDFGEGGTFEIRALRPGVIHYLCTLHPATMNGTIEVVG